MNDNEELDVVHDVLACTYRRQAMKHLIAAEDGVAVVAELVEDIVGHDEATEDRRSAAIKLHHVTLPKLAAYGFIEYDARSQTVRYREAPVLERELHRSAYTPEVS